LQTFLPVTSFVKSMEFLDNRRLGKQRVEAGQILEILLDQAILPKSLDSVVPFDRQFKAWTRHPAVLMWVGHEEWLKLYLACAIGEWQSRGYQNSISVPPYNTSLQPHPEWLGYESFHESHRANLVRKDPGHYHRYWPDVNPSLKYFWPTHEGFSITKAA
jgi:pyrimidine dimer DNA glycosylase